MTRRRRSTTFTSRDCATCLIDHGQYCPAMARITEFFKTTGTARPHPTQVECGWQVIEGEQTLLQLSTYGSDHRMSNKKVSQTLQLDRERARELLRIIRSAFPED